MSTATAGPRVEALHEKNRRFSFGERRGCRSGACGADLEVLTRVLVLNGERIIGSIRLSSRSHRPGRRAGAGSHPPSRRSRRAPDLIAFMVRNAESFDFLCCPPYRCTFCLLSRSLSLRSYRA